MNTTPPKDLRACVDSAITQCLSTSWSIMGRSPLEGFDCWGFVRYLYVCMGWDSVPDFLYESVEELSLHVQDQEQFWTELATAAPYSIVTMGKNEVTSHVGFLHPDGLIFHCTESGGVVGHKPTVLRRFGFKNLRYFQHKDMPWLR